MENIESYKKIINNYKNKNILVIGDSILDMYLQSDVNRISPEAPVPVALVKDKKYVLGGAANTANNLATLGINTTLVSVIGKGEEHKSYLDLLQSKNISSNGVFFDNSRMMTVKKRVVSGNQQLIRIDQEDLHDISIDIENKIIDFLYDQKIKADAIVLSDYAKGCLTSSLIKRIFIYSKELNIPVFVDPKPNKNKDISLYKDAWLIKPNRKEAEVILNKKLSFKKEDLKNIFRELKSIFSKNIVVTVGKDGMYIWSHKENGFYHLETTKQDFFDVCGAGDTTMAVLVASICGGASLIDAAIMANHAAGVVIKKKGTSICTVDDLLNSFL